MPLIRVNAAGTCIANAGRTAVNAASPEASQGVAYDTSTCTLGPRPALDGTSRCSARRTGASAAALRSADVLSLTCSCRWATAGSPSTRAVSDVGATDCAGSENTSSTAGCVEPPCSSSTVRCCSTPLAPSAHGHTSWWAESAGSVLGAAGAAFGRGANATMHSSSGLAAPNRSGATDRCTGAARAAGAGRSNSSGAESGDERMRYAIS